ncbi:MAG: hypothetical protein ACYCYA_01825, partial [Actinomycetes bacterium]
APAHVSAPAPASAPAPLPVPPLPVPPAPVPSDLASLRARWPAVLDAVLARKKATWALLSHHAQVTGVDARRLVLGVSTSGLADTFRSGPGPEVVREALREVTGLDRQVEVIVDASAGLGSGVAGASAPASTGAFGSAPVAPAADIPDLEDRAAEPDPGGEVSGQELLARELGATVVREYEP